MHHVTGYFPNQFSAAAIVDKMLGRGMPRDRIVVATDESIGDSPASSNAPSNVLSDVSHLGRNRQRDSGGRGLASDRSVTPDAPETLGKSMVTVTTGGEWSETVLRGLMETAGAEDVVSGSDDVPQENEGVWPAPSEGDAIDVERAIAASRRGASDAGSSKP
ncbi:hypothetical protein J2T07_000793 [Luteibacter jiangsuensis]|uniref:Beta-ketoacyl synthase-like protein n=1 Tax=Luteibacter jiangsuensis TaxID=637577 RepID=A0ABT9SVT3_9GAMM|nr:hypothetical protein [Luteibacter jiangsuensis]MDQ0008634.1 hypothetical protein [Luteibacter jiangsuensis]